MIDEGKPIIPAILMRLVMLVLLMLALALALFLMFKIGSKFHPNGWHIFGFIVLMVLLVKLIPAKKSNKKMLNDEQPVETKEPLQQILDDLDKTKRPEN